MTPPTQRALTAAANTLTAHFIQLLSQCPKTPEVIAAPTQRYLNTRSLVERALVGLLGMHSQPVRLRWTASEVFVGDIDTTRVLRDRPHLLALYQLLAQSPLVGLRFDAAPTPLMLDVLAQHLAPFTSVPPPTTLPPIDLPRVHLLRNSAPRMRTPPPPSVATTPHLNTPADAHRPPKPTPPDHSPDPYDPRPDAYRLLATTRMAAADAPEILHAPDALHHQCAWTLTLRGVIACAQRALDAPDGLIACLNLTAELRDAESVDAVAARAALAAMLCAAPLRPSRDDLLAISIAALLGPIALHRARALQAPDPLRCALAWVARERLVLSSSQLHAIALLAQALDACAAPHPQPQPPHIALLLNAWRFAATPAPRSGEPSVAHERGWGAALDGEAPPSAIEAAFLHQLILYPVGTLLVLNDGREGVISGSTSPKRDLAIVGSAPNAAPCFTLNLARLRNVHSVIAPSPERAEQAWSALIRTWRERGS